MEKILHCTSCLEQIKENFFNFSCNHIICSNCIHKNLIFMYDNIIHSKDVNSEMEISCLYCNAGIFKSTIKNLFELLPEYHGAVHESFVIEELCSIHKKIIINYCCECKWKMCDICLENHNQIPPFVNHVVSKNLKLSKIRNTCNKHNNPAKKLKYFCKTCSKAVCSVCIELEDHRILNGHELVYIVDYYKNFEKEIVTTKLPFISYEEFGKFLDSERKQALEQINLCSTNMNDTIQRINQSLQDFKEDFNRKVESTEEVLKLKYSMIDFIVKKFYEDISEIEKEDYRSLDTFAQFQKVFNKFHSIILNEYNMERICAEFEKKLQIEKSIEFEVKTYNGLQQIQESINNILKISKDKHDIVIHGNSRYQNNLLNPIQSSSMLKLGLNLEKK